MADVEEVHIHTWHKCTMDVSRLCLIQGAGSSVKAPKVVAVGARLV
jgi:hypothetical protein